MSDQAPQNGPHEQDPEPETGVPDDPSTPPVGATRTGVPAIDEVLDDVDRLDDRPLDEHLTAFERAHESLRSALDAEPGDPA
jgi:hypothetical protein